MQAKAKVRILGTGSAPVSMLIHGMASSGRVWLKMLRNMAAPAHSRAQALCGTFVMPDLPGMGESDLIPGIAFSDWLGFVRQLSRTQAGQAYRASQSHGVRLAGHSLGGALAMFLAGEDWVDSVALVSPATGPFCREMRKVCRPGSRPGTIQLRRAPGSLACDPLSLAREDAAILREDYARASPLLEGGLPWPDFGEDDGLLAGKRVLVVWGEEDRVVAPGYARELSYSLAARGISVETASIPDCGHVPMLERPTELARILQGFWNRQESPSVSL